MRQAVCDAKVIWPSDCGSADTTTTPVLSDGASCCVPSATTCMSECVSGSAAEVAWPPPPLEDASSGEARARSASSAKRAASIVAASARSGSLLTCREGVQGRGSGVGQALSSTPRPAAAASPHRKTGRTGAWPRHSARGGCGRGDSVSERERQKRGEASLLPSSTHL